MRIQHNITAMNSYRNYTNNASALSKNLEKLSSGYKINRAGDDAAGLAISEKMRAQITGLNAAQKNVKDGISLVKTAEGALQEVHDMLNRMDYLATQSANGTYDNEVDRANLQKETQALLDEIDRIADSSNFNGQKLLDGSLSELDIKIGNAKVGGSEATVTDLAATGAESVVTIDVGNASKKSILTVNYVDADGKAHTVKVDYTASSSAGKNLNAIMGALQKNEELSNIFKIEAGGGKNQIKLTSKVTGPNGAKLSNITTDDKGVTFNPTTDVTDGEVAKKKVNGNNPLKKDDTITINGRTYQMVDKAGDKVAEGNIAVVLGSSATKTIASLNEALKSSGIKVTGTKTEVLTFEPSEPGAGLKLQIGDTADSYNQMKVKVGDMHTDALGIKGLDISTIAGANEAIAKIKDAINFVSSTRGDLGANQNRLEHTANNLSTMEENIQDAESTIRDTDVADEMTAYTKNNILLQSAQAMLAQANQLPQGVLQLLQ